MHTDPMKIPCDDWHRSRRILAVRLDNFGDVLMCTPALAAIRANRPHAQLALWCSPSAAQAARACGLLDEVLPFKAPWMKHAHPSPLVHGIAQLQAGRFEAAVIFTSCTQSALPAAMACLQAGIPLRLAHSREQPYHLLTHWVHDQEEVHADMRHEVRRQLDLVASLGWSPPHERLRFEVSREDEARGLAMLRQHGLSEGRPYVVMHPGASAPSRRYPAERFGMVAEALWRCRGVRTVFTGTEEDRPLVARARAQVRSHAIDLSGHLSLGELGGVIAQASLLVSNNTGPVHVAAALSTPVVDLYVLTNPQHTPWQSPATVLFNDVPCRHCLQSVCPETHQACLTGVPPDTVVQACLALLPC